MAVVDSAEREVVPELGVPLFCQCFGPLASYRSSAGCQQGESRYSRSHVRRGHRVGGRRRQVDQGRSSHFATDRWYSAGEMVDEGSQWSDMITSRSIRGEIETPSGGVILCYINRHTW